MARRVLGIGHTLTLLVAGTLLVVLRADMPAMARTFFAFAVVLLLVGFGVRAIYLSAGQAAAGPTHSHGTLRRHQLLRSRRWTLARRPLLVGAVHGLGGQRRAHRARHGDDPVDGARLIYLALFGVGSTLGMAALSGLWAGRLPRRNARRGRTQALAGGRLRFDRARPVWGYPLIGRLF